MNRRRLLRRIQQGHLQNVRYADFVELVKGFGFVYDHTTGSHQIYKHPLVQRPFPLQPLRGEAKVQGTADSRALEARGRLQFRVRRLIH